MLLTKIMVAVDGSEPSLKAVTFASQLAKQNSSKLIMLNVALLPAFASAKTIESLRTDLSKRSSELLETARSAARGASVDAETRMVETNRSVVQTIIEVSNHEKPDLLVVGSRGMTPGRLMLGSIAAGVANLAQCSVLVVR